MDNNPKKSKAFIITFILLLLLLVVGYYLFTNRAKIFDAKGAMSISKIFSPLLGTSKSGSLKVIDGTGGTGTSATKTGITGNVITTENGNKVVRAEAGENLKKGDVLYISGFNKNNDPIVMRAIANDKAKSLVFGVAGEDMNKGAMGNVIIQGILSGVPTNRNEGTLWASKNPLYLSDNTFGGMTKNPPTAKSSFVVPVGSVLIVDPVNGSIHIGGLDKDKNINNIDKNNLKSFNSELLNGSSGDLRSFWNSIFGGGYAIGSNGQLINVGANGTGSGFTGTGGSSTGSGSGFTGTGGSSTGSGSGFTGTGGSSTGTGTGNGSGFTGTGGGTFDNSGLSWNNNGFDLMPIEIPTYSYNASDYTSGGDYTGGGTYTGGGDYTGTTFPSVVVTASPSSIKTGETTTISWKAINATKCDAGAGNGTGITGSFKTAKLTGNKSFTVVCTDINGSESSGNTYVMITDLGSNTAPMVTVTAKPAFVKPGQTTTISWKATNAVSCNAGPGNGTGTTGSFKTTSLTGDISYAVVCTGKDGSTVGSDVVVVVNNNNNVCPGGQDNYPLCNMIGGKCENGTTNPPLCTILPNNGGCYNGADNPTDCTTINGQCVNGMPNPPLCANTDTYVYPTMTLKALPMTVGVGEKATIAWTSKNSTTCDSGTGNPTTTDGSFTTEALTTGKSYAVSCTGPNGTAAASVYVGVLSNISTFVTVNLKASPPSVVSGQSSTISWISTNATKCDAGAGNGTGKTGSFTTGPLTEAKSYAITCTGANGSMTSNINIAITTGTNTTPTDQPAIVVPPTKGVCLASQPLEFTVEEQKRLDELTRKFYLLAPTIRTEDDVNLSASEIVEQQNLLDQVKGLTKECYLQTGETAMYTTFCSINPAYCDKTNDKVLNYPGNKIKYGNPWYQPTNRGTYIPGFENFELMLNLW